MLEKINNSNVINAQIISRARISKTKRHIKEECKTKWRCENSTTNVYIRVALVMSHKNPSWKYSFGWRVLWWKGIANITTYFYKLSSFLFVDLLRNNTHVDDSISHVFKRYLKSYLKISLVYWINWWCNKLSVFGWKFIEIKCWES